MNQHSSYKSNVSPNTLTAIFVHFTIYRKKFGPLKKNHRKTTWIIKQNVLKKFRSMFLKYCKDYKSLPYTTDVTAEGEITKTDE